MPVLKTADLQFLWQEQFPGAPVRRALTDNRTANLQFRFQNWANEVGLNCLYLGNQKHKSGPEMYWKWIWSGFEVGRKWIGNWPEVDRKMTGSGSKVNRKWTGSGPEVEWIGKEYSAYLIALAKYFQVIFKIY